MVPTSDKLNSMKANIQMEEKSRELEQENKKIREELKNKENILTENKELKTKLEKEDFKIINVQRY